MTPAERAALLALMTARDFPVVIPKRPAWMADAACIEHPEVEFIPPSTSSEDHATRARAVCGRCLCRAECLAYALADPTLLGVWGGTSTAERRAMRRRSAA